MEDWEPPLGLDLQFPKRLTNFQMMRFPGAFIDTSQNPVPVKENPSQDYETGFALCTASCMMQSDVIFHH
jgi:hypothetical protein